MWIHPQFNPIAVQVGPIAIHWYGLMYLLGFFSFLLLGRYHSRRVPIIEQKISYDDINDLLFYGVFGVVLGGRLGYVLFYMPTFYFAHPLEIFKIWQGGMSFHGGFLGVLLAIAFFCYHKKRPFLQITDFIAPLIPIGIMFGRIGNFINGELWGRVSINPIFWAIGFPNAADADRIWLSEHSPVQFAALYQLYTQYHLLPRHPSQLYQAALEGLVLFILLWFSSTRMRPVGAISALFLIGYGIFRFAIEYTREPDAFLGLLGGFSMGQWLSLPMIIGGILLMVVAYRHTRWSLQRLNKPLV